MKSPTLSTTAAGARAGVTLLESQVAKDVRDTVILGVFPEQGLCVGQYPVDLVFHE